MKPLGTAVHRVRTGPHSVIGDIETSMVGNVVLRVGRTNSKGWEQTEHVVLGRNETRELINTLEAQLDGEVVHVDHGDLLEACQAANAWASYQRHSFPEKTRWQESADRIDAAVARLRSDALGEGVVTIGVPV